MEEPSQARKNWIHTLKKRTPRKKKKKRHLQPKQLNNLANRIVFFEADSMAEPNLYS